jgi:AmiR/NasT family two-component response regulator
MKGGEIVGKDGGEQRRGLKVLAADEDEQALERTERLLRELGHEVTAIAVSVDEAAAAIARDEPDVSIVVVHTDDEHALDLIEEIGEFATGPVIALLPSEHPAFVTRAAERGIFAYAQTPTAESVQGAIEVALRRAEEARELTEQVERLEGALERRAVIERAKGILMERHGIDEREAFERIRSHARASSRPVVELAKAVADGHLLLPKRSA